MLRDTVSQMYYIAVLVYLNTTVEKILKYTCVRWKKILAYQTETCSACKYKYHMIKYVW